jgi:hypothetical protein
MVRSCPAFPISDTVHVVSRDMVDDRDKPESGEADDRRDFFACGWDDEAVSPSILSGFTDGVLLPIKVEQIDLLFMIYLQEHVYSYGFLQL